MAVEVNIILVLMELVLEVLEVVVMEAIPLILFLQEVQTPVVVEAVGLVILLLSKIMVPVVEQAYADAGCPDRFKVYQPPGNHVFEVEYFEWMVAWFERFLKEV